MNSRSNKFVAAAALAFCALISFANDSIKKPSPRKTLDSIYINERLVKNTILISFSELLRGNAQLHYDRHIHAKSSINIGAGINITKDPVFQYLYPAVYSADGTPGAMILSLLNEGKRSNGGFNVTSSFKFYPGKGYRSSGFYFGVESTYYVYCVKAIGLRTLPNGQPDLVYLDKVTEVFSSVNEYGYFMKDETFTIDNLLLGPTTGFKLRTLNKYKLIFDWSFQIMANRIRGNRMQIKPPKNNATYSTVEKLTDKYTIKKFYVQLEMKIGFGR